MELPKRKPNRLKHYDYSQNGVYFITICTKDRHEFLWNAEADMRRPHETAPLSEYGEIIDRAIASVSRCYPDVKVDTYVIMPNHLHMILILSSGDGRMISAPTKDVSTIVGQLKRWVTQQTGFSLWQKSFHDHIIRNEHEYQMMWEYIDTNPIKWAEDCFYQHP